MRARSLAVTTVGLAAVAIATAFGSALVFDTAPAWAPFVLVAGTALLLAALVVLGGWTHRGSAAVWIAAATILLVVGGGLAAAFALGTLDDPATGRLFGGLPRAAALLVYGVGLLPALIVPLVYAWTFDRTTLTAADLERVRAAARRVEAGAAESADESPS